MGLIRYATKRFLYSIPVLLGVSILVFLLVHMAPAGPARVIMGPEGDPELQRRLREAMHLNEPIYIQYQLWLLDILQGDFGNSMTVQPGTPVTEIIMKRIPLTIELTFVSYVVALTIGIPAGIISAVKQDTYVDHVSRVGALAGVSIPNFWLGIMLILTFGVMLQQQWAVGGWVPPWENLSSNILHLIMPAIALGTAHAALVMRVMRSELLDVIGQDYIRTARAMGMPYRKVILRDGVQNAFIPVLTVIGAEMGKILSGAIVTETVFNLPGIGTLLIVGITRRDFRIIQALVLMIAVSYILINLLVDILYAYLDPRIRYDTRE